MAIARALKSCAVVRQTDAVTITTAARTLRMRRDYRKTRELFEMPDHRIVIGTEALIEAPRRRAQLLRHVEEQVIETAHHVGVAEILALQSRRPLPQHVD